MKSIAKIQTKIALVVTTALLVFTPLIGMTLSPATTYAATTPVTTNQTQASSQCCKNNGPSLSTLSTNNSTGGGEKCLVECYINPIVELASGLVGVFVALSIIIAGIQYSGSADDPSKVQQAKDRIRNAMIALLAYLFLLAFVSWILPGGIQP